MVFRPDVKNFVFLTSRIIYDFFLQLQFIINISVKFPSRNIILNKEPFTNDVISLGEGVFKRGRMNHDDGQREWFWLKMPPSLNNVYFAKFSIFYRFYDSISRKSIWIFTSGMYVHTTSYKQNRICHVQLHISNMLTGAGPGGPEELSTSTIILSGRQENEPLSPEILANIWRSKK